MTHTFGLIAQRFVTHWNSQLVNTMLLSIILASHSQKWNVFIFTSSFQPLKPYTDYSKHDERLALALTESSRLTDHFLKRSRETANQNRSYQALYESR